MVSDVSAMMNTVSQASNRPSSERPQQTDSYHDMMKNMLKEQKRIKEEKKPGSDNDSTKVNAKEKPDKDEEGKKPAETDGSAVFLPPGNGEFQSVLWMQQPAAMGDAVPETGLQPVDEGNVAAVMAEMQTETVDEAAEGPMVGNQPEKPEGKEFLSEPAFTVPENDIPEEKSAAVTVPVQISEGKDEDVSDLQTAVNMQTEVENVSENENLSEKRVDENAQLYAQADVKAADDRIVQQGPQTEMPVTQETPESPEEMFQTLPKEIFTRISAGEKEFTVQLEPENLGKLMIKASYADGKASISIICTNEKTMELLSGHAREIGGIMESNLGTPTTVLLDKTEPDYLEQGQDGQNGRQENARDDEGRDKKEQKKNGLDFLHQLRLGLV